MAKRTIIIFIATFVLSGVAAAIDVPIPGKALVVKPGKLAKFTSKGAFSLPTPGSAEDPTIVGAELQFVDVDGTDAVAYVLGPFGWKGLGDPAGSKGYRYKGKADPSYADPADTCRTVVLKPDRIKAVCKGAKITITPPLAGVGAFEIGFPAGDPTLTYCASFGGTEKKNDASAVRRVDAAAPAECLGPPQCGPGFGECPDAFFCAILPPDPSYFCAPTFCSGGSYPTCSGGCSGGWECKPADLGGSSFCLCSPPATECDAACNGFACSGGGICTFDPTSGDCGCAP